MKTQLIDEGLAFLKHGIKNPIPENLTYKILIADVGKLTNTWNSIKIAKIISSPEFEPLVPAEQGAKRLLDVEQKTPTHLFYYPILSELLSTQGPCSIKQIYNSIQHNQVLTLRDLALVGGKKSEPLWKVTVRWAKEELVSKGFIRRHAKRGYWELTDEGRQWLVNLSLEV
jgi:Mrr N-terminal domain